MNKRHAFTLIELLVVIAIIGIIAALVVNGVAHANAAKRNALVSAQKQGLMVMIDNYQSKLNFYPPDNANLVNYPPGPLYDAYAATNPLLYELTGATNLQNQIQAFDSPPTINIAKTYLPTYARSSVNNGNPDEPHDFYIPGPQSRDYTNYNISGIQPPEELRGLLVPSPATNDPSQNNFWHYDSSSTNRHNPSSYDLWAEYISSSKNGTDVITTNGNW